MFLSQIQWLKTAVRSAVGLVHTPPSGPRQLARSGWESQRARLLIVTNSSLPAIQAEEAPLRQRPSLYPEPFASRMAGRMKRPLGNLFGLSRFGVN